MQRTCGGNQCPNSMLPENLCQKHYGTKMVKLCKINSFWLYIVKSICVTINHFAMEIVLFLLKFSDKRFYHLLLKLLSGQTLLLLAVRSRRHQRSLRRSVGHQLVLSIRVSKKSTIMENKSKKVAQRATIAHLRASKSYKCFE